jgi:hypothetical protein
VPTRVTAAIAVAGALLCAAALAAAGCGLGAGEGRGDVTLTVTRDFGARPMLERRVGDVVEADTVMRALERSAEISTRYGGAFVQSIDGLAGERRDGRPYDWFFYVNGLWSPVGAADYPLRGGEAIWWDYRVWSASGRVSAPVGSWPQPFAGGYEGRRHPTAVECRGGGDACAIVRRRLRRAGATVEGTVAPAAGEPSGSAGGRGEGGPAGPVAREDAAGAGDEAIRVLVGPWARLRRDPAAADIEAGPATSGVYATFTRSAAAAPTASPRTAATRSEGQDAPDSGRDAGGRRDRRGAFLLWGLDEGGERARRFGPGAGLVAATRRGDAPPVWVVTGAGAAGASAAARLLSAAALRDRFAVATESGRQVALPLGRRSGER